MTVGLRSTVDRPTSCAREIGKQAALAKALGFSAGHVEADINSYYNH